MLCSYLLSKHFKLIEIWISWKYLFWGPMDFILNIISHIKLSFSSTSTKVRGGTNMSVVESSLSINLETCMPSSLSISPCLNHSSSSKADHRFERKKGLMTLLRSAHLMIICRNSTTSPLLLRGGNDCFSFGARVESISLASLVESKTGVGDTSSFRGAIPVCIPRLPSSLSAPNFEPKT